MKKIQVQKRQERHYKYRIEYVYGDEIQVEKCDDLYDSWAIIAQYVLQHDINFYVRDPFLRALLTLAPLLNMTEGEMLNDKKLLAALSQFEFLCFIYDEDSYIDNIRACDYIRIYEADESYGIQVDLDDMKEWLKRHDFIQ